MTFLQESAGMPCLKLKIMHVGIGVESQFLYLSNLLVLSLKLILLRLLILIFSEIHDLTYGRGGIGYDFDQVKSPSMSNLHRFDRIHDADLSLFINDTHLRCADFFIYSNAV